MGACKQSIIDTPEENYTELLGGDPSYDNWLDKLEQDNERDKQEPETMESGREDRS